MEIDADHDSDIPDFVRAWHPSVRRPIIPPNPAIYHEGVHPRAIFELCETPSSEYIYVVSYPCTHCRTLKQFCSRSWPSCDRCARTGRPCNATQPGYQKLPPPKGTNPRKHASITAPPPIPGMSSALPSKRAAALRSSQSITTSSNPQSPKNPKPTHSSSSNPPPPKKQRLTHSSPQSASKQTSGCRGNKKKVDGNSPQNKPLKEPVNPEARNGDSSASTAPVWTFVRPPKTEFVIDSSAAVPVVDTPTRTPRVWANSRADVASIFPELTKSLTGILWRQFEMPALFLEHHRPQYSWRDKNTLEVVLEWTYQCGPEVLVHSDSHDKTHDKRPSDNSHAARVEECGSVKNSAPSFTPIKQDLQFNFSLSNPLLAAGSEEVLPSNTATVSQLSTLAPVPLLDSPSLPVLLPSLVQPPETAVSSSTTPKIQPRMPGPRPSEIEALDQCLMKKDPLLVFVSRESGLLPHQLPPEYTYCCLGLFFISDLNADIDNTVIAISKTQKSGRVRWRLTLEWAPGGEDALSENISETSCPWWIDPVDYLVEKGAGSVKTPYRPRDLSIQHFSFLPLDLLAGFKPSECFPRGWYCKECGMLNAQRCFRHQICQSSWCKRKMERGKTTNDNALICHVDPLQAVRGLQRLRIWDPLDDAPSSVGKFDCSWDDKMRTLTYEVNSGVRVQHVFTGNQEILQQDATKLLLDVQKDVILSRNDLHSPYFTWSTKLDPGHTYAEDPAGNPETPRLVFNIQEVLLHYMQAYGEIKDANINHILIQAWVNPGSKRGAVFNAKSHVVTIICLGAEVVMNLVPKRGFTEIPIETAENRMEIDSERILSASQLVCSSEPLASAAVIVPDGYRQPGGDKNAANQHDPASLAVGEASKPAGNVGDGKTAAGKGKGTGGKKSKQAPLELSMTLVHGDAIILEGDDFEYQIKRSGTTILLIGSYE
ncbi:hypothetical protein DEU56DRAFT_268405 [Suillus clintonianus]|uniref:uncharacterized protein n=1 Tax=Suillus clintonianus TaxID=1904413 RepID=UPI001B86C8BD|nr:uncharacterized protein DEU56DRAFT_268405 [Suillus clintonianus]KAG2141857.1 hypothetical protein DEU56DRAFT_268405 [Suillus clintonianus]